MAAKKTNWGAVAGIAGALLLLWLFWPKSAQAKSAGSGAGGGSPWPFPPLGGQRPTLGTSAGGASGGGGSIGPIPALHFGASPLAKWIKGVLNQGYANAAQIPILSTSGALAAQGIPLDPLQNFDLSQLSFSLPDAGFYSGNWTDPNSLVNFTDPSLMSFGYQPVDWSSQNNFLVTQDIPQPIDLSSYGIDPNYGSDMLQTDNVDSYSSLSQNDTSGSYLPTGL